MPRGRHHGCHVSIHAPARGATWPLRSCPECLHVSIHAPARGATHNRILDRGFRGFQSTPPHGGRPKGRATAPLRRGFNPRPRTGGDTIPSKRITRVWWFQSTPPHGGRLSQANTLCDNTKKTGRCEPYPALFVKNSYRHHRDSNLFKYQ